MALAAPCPAALLKLSRRVRISGESRVRSICLPPAPHNSSAAPPAPPAPGESKPLCMATGWGRQSAAGDETSTLLQASVPLHSNALCAKRYGGAVRIGPGHLCAGHLDGSSGTCVVSQPRPAGSLPERDHHRAPVERGVGSPFYYRAVRYNRRAPVGPSVGTTLLRSVEQLLCSSNTFAFPVWQPVKLPYRAGPSRSACGTQVRQPVKLPCRAGASPSACGAPVEAGVGSLLHAIVERLWMRE